MAAPLSKAKVLPAGPGAREADGLTGGERCGGGGVAAAVVAGRCWLRYAAYADFFDGVRVLRRGGGANHSTGAHSTSYCGAVF